MNNFFLLAVARALQQVSVAPATKTLFLSSSTLSPEIRIFLELERVIIFELARLVPSFSHTSL